MAVGANVFKYKNGDVLETYVWDNFSCCDGVFMYTTIDVQKGTSVRFAMTCSGVKKYKNGDVYEGQFKSGERHGMGTMKYANGTVHTGRWDEGMTEFQMGVSVVIFLAGNKELLPIPS